MEHSKFTPQRCNLPDATAKALVRKSLIAEQGNEWHLTECGTAYLDYLSGATP